eukprot:scaffold1025_cov102-Cylindrotheca_fusiformis.AAC.3
MDKRPLQKMHKKDRDTFFSSSSELNKADGRATSLESTQKEKRPEKNRDTFSASSSESTADFM